MNDSSRTGLDTETPVNPYSQLEAVNRSSDTANTAWLLFIGLMAYLLIMQPGGKRFSWEAPICATPTSCARST